VGHGRDPDHLDIALREADGSARDDVALEVLTWIYKTIS
jgi:hypothetical protein